MSRYKKDAYRLLFSVELQHFVLCESDAKYQYWQSSHEWVSTNKEEVLMHFLEEWPELKKSTTLKYDWQAQWFVRDWIKKNYPSNVIELMKFPK